MFPFLVLVQNIIKFHLRVNAFCSVQACDPMSPDQPLLLSLSLLGKDRVFLLQHERGVHSDLIFRTDLLTTGTNNH